MSLWPSPWPAQDGGPRRWQAPAAGAGLGIRPGERLVTTAVRDAFATTMVVLREPGEVFVLRHTLGRRPLRDETTAWVERIDPLISLSDPSQPELIEVCGAPRGAAPTHLATTPSAGSQSDTPPPTASSPRSASQSGCSGRGSDRWRTPLT